MSLEQGQSAPDFTLQDDQGNTRTLADFAGKTTVFYFYPKDNTPGCTTESQNFRDLYQEFQGEGIEIVGISPDSVKSHQNFKKKHDLPFTLLSDPEKVMLEAYGAWGEKKMYGRTFMGVIRSTVIVDGQGVVKQAFPKVRVKGHADAVLSACRL